VAQPTHKFGGGKNLGGAKMFDFRRITLFCLEKRLSKHEMTIFSKNVGETWSLWPSLSTPMNEGLQPTESNKLLKSNTLKTRIFFI